VTVELQFVSGRSTSRFSPGVRLTEDEIEVVAAAYQDGLTLTERASAFGPDRRTLASRIETGIPRRHRRLTDQQIADAIELYTADWSLAKIATQFGVYPTSIRYRLEKAGVVFRPRPGWPDKSE
jgi:hypothetical protein